MMERIDFNRGWEFQKEGAERWQAVNLPHDAMLTEQRDPYCPNGANTGFYPGGKYLYRKRFQAPAEWEGRCVLLAFEGVYRNSTVAINGKAAGGHRYGYSQFYVDAAPYLRFGEENEVVVRVDNAEEPNSRWYSGSGIYRPVKLAIGNKTHIEIAGVKILTKSLAPAIVEIETKFSDGEKVQPEVRIEISFAGEIIAVGSGARQRLEIHEPRLWSDKTPNLYEARVMLVDGENVIDAVTERFGLRMIEVDAQNGLRINGEITKLRGACIHSDNGILGACSFAAAEERRIRILKEAGFNAVRSAHNPLSKAALDACDQYGMYVMDEAFDMWYIPKTRYDYARDFEQWHLQDLAAMVDKDFNHPSVIIYSIGNEVSETAQERGIRLAEEMTGFLHSLDPSRPVTCGINLMLNGLVSIGLGFYKDKRQPEEAQEARKRKASPKKKLTGSAYINWFMNRIGSFMNNIGRMKFVDRATRDAFRALDIAGYNYGRGRYPLEGKAHPERVVVGSETFAPELYENWRMVEKYPYLVGDFLWSGWDYLGEGGIGAVGYESRMGGRGGISGITKPYPHLTADTGVIDITGYARPEVFYSQLVWGLRQAPYIAVEPLTFAGEKRVLSMWRRSDGRASWAWAGCEGERAEVLVYANSDSVELRLNDRSLGRKKVKECTAVFRTRYEKGALLAIAYDRQGAETGRWQLLSASEKLQLAVQAEKTELKADGEDLATLDIALVDEKGVVESAADRRITVKVEGAGTLQGLGSGDPCTEERFDQGYHDTFFGRAQAIVRSGYEQGTVKVTVSAEGLGSEEVLLEVR
jgi:hypothetical protein